MKTNNTSDNLVDKIPFAEIMEDEEEIPFAEIMEDEEEIPFAKLVETEEEIKPGSFVYFPEDKNKTDNENKIAFRDELRDKINNVHTGISEWVVNYDLRRIRGFELEGLHEQVASLALKVYEETALINQRLSNQKDVDKNKRKKYEELQRRMLEKADNHYKQAISNNYNAGCWEAVSNRFLNNLRKYPLPKSLEVYNNLSNPQPVTDSGFFRRVLSRATS